jgi:hypothetical protein
LYAAPSGAWNQEVPEAEREIFEIDPAVTVMVQISEYHVTVRLKT